MKGTLLAVFAHPDDETFSCGGTLAHYAALGHHVVLVCATRGEAGEISDPALATPDTLGDVREGELKCAAEMLGIGEIIFLDYRDSGMAGTPENEDPAAFINAPAAEVVPRLVAIIRDLRPQIVVTFEPHGGYGHPDHIAIHHHTVSAFHAAAEPDAYPDLGAPWQAQRLYYTALPTSFFAAIRAVLEEWGVDTAEFDRFEEDGIRGWPDEQVHIRMDVSDAIAVKWEAFACHRTQVSEDNLFHRLPDEVMKRLMSTEYFALAWPEPEAGWVGTDLWEGLGGA